MLEIYPNLHIGAQVDYEQTVKHQANWQVVHACKEPYHRAALGYMGRGAPKIHPEYLIARRGNRLILNLVDATDAAYIPAEIINATLAFIHVALQQPQRVLVHCNQGESRAPALGLLYLAAYTNVLNAPDFAAAEAAYRRLYPAYNPSQGMRGFMLANWGKYARQPGS